jgi:hypothetical protein
MKDSTAMQDAVGVLRMLILLILLYVRVIAVIVAVECHELVT